ncbi:hypothetical protein NM688_g806 [Phlebia brevispora]|uniref:Uncharacterized protein n=1 Tax=Phlebia brevispora TaxID=194682 RepID=A0ACC1TDF7_9APHY|nr:hypothetical protein NM688_g806 [Phlebia brevispora]
MEITPDFALTFSIPMLREKLLTIKKLVEMKLAHKNKVNSTSKSSKHGVCLPHLSEQIIASHQDTNEPSALVEDPLLSVTRPESETAPQPPNNAENDIFPSTERSGEQDTAVSANQAEQLKETRKTQAGEGLLKHLSDACRKCVRVWALTDLLGYVYDNINPRFKVTQQSLGRKDSVKSGTCATAFALFDASTNDMKTENYLKSFVEVPLLSLDDISPSEEENNLLQERMAHTVLHIIVTFGGSHFAQFKKDVMESTPASADKIAEHETEVFPLPTMHIDESSMTGNAEVIFEMFRKLSRPFCALEFTKVVKIIAGDQLSIALFMPELFHYKLAITHRFMEIHYGKSNSTANPGCLNFHNTVFDRKPIVLSSLLPFCTTRDLIFVSLYTRMFTCLMLVTNVTSLDDYATKDLTFKELKEDACELVNHFANPAAARRLHCAPNSTLTKGDMVYENAILFMRDALILHEFNDGIKAGDSGHVVLVLKYMALMYRGKIVLKNWLVNTTGKPNAWSEVDLLQEHLNFWIKSLQEHGVYVIEEDRIIDQDKLLVPNVISTELKELHEPLNEYNKMFQRLQQHCRTHPLVGDPYIAATEGSEDADPSCLQEDIVPILEDVLSIIDETASDEDTEDDDDAFWQWVEEKEDGWFSLESTADVALDQDAVDDIED